MAALQFVDVPGYSALILRRKLQDLGKSGGLIHRAHEWLDGYPELTWKEQAKRWVFPSGAVIQFGYLDSVGDRQQFEGTEWAGIFVDELPQFRRQDWLFLFSRLRRPADLDGDNPLGRVPLRARGTGNPGPPWVWYRFVADPADPTVDFEHLGDKDRSDRSFHPAKLADNPYLDGADYRRGLAQMSPIQQRQLLDGEWNIRLKGNVFDRDWFPVVQAAPAQIAKTVRYWDLAATAEEHAAGKDPDYTCGALAHRLVDNRMVVADLYHERISPAEIEHVLAEYAANDGQHVEIWVEQEPGAGGKIAVNHIQRNVLSGRIVRTHPKRVDKLTAAGPWAALAGNQRGVLLLPGRWNAGLFEQMDAFPATGREHDDMVDAVSGAFHALFGKGKSGPIRIARPRPDTAPRPLAATSATARPSLVHRPRPRVIVPRR